MSMIPDERRAKKNERNRQYYEANKDRVNDKHRQYREFNKEELAERRRRHYEANKERIVEQNRRRYEADKDRVAEKSRQYHEANRDTITERKRRNYDANKEKMAERNRRYLRKKSFAKEDGSSFKAWLASIYNPNKVKVFEAIANLTPDPGQTLAELIHELSGYAMEVCEQIANPTVIEDSPTLTPAPAPDLF